MSEALGKLGWDVRRLGYRRSFDGVRALSILLVALTHGGAGFRGGYIGLDMFFVLSGFLITSLLLEEWNITGRVDRRAFYGRRAKRLLPALFATLAGFWVLKFAMPGLDHGWSIVPRSLVIIFYAANWVVVKAGEHPLGALNQTWSLAVEEQFYLIWPLIFVACFRRRWRPEKVLLLVVGLAAASAAWRAYLFAVPHSSFPFGPYGTTTYWRSDTHADGLALGCALAVALATSRGREILAKTCRSTLAVVAALVFLGFVVDRTSIYSHWMYFGGWAAVNLAIAFILAHIYVRERAVVPRVLAMSPLVWIGKRSYGIYLVHLPIFFALSPARTHLSMWPRFGLRMAVTCAVAAAMFKWVETPFLRRKRYPSPNQTHEPVDGFQAPERPVDAPALPATGG
jgi:peptidoglycan/LPS O-acetylase OafA/YrhL